jgi:hypothetical protein
LRVLQLQIGDVVKMTASRFREHYSRFRDWVAGGRNRLGQAVTATVLAGLKEGGKNCDRISKGWASERWYVSNGLIY